MSAYRRGSVSSADGTIIGYRQLGSGPAVLVLHGGMQTSQHMLKLASTLSAAFTVYLPDRRGRGLSGGHGDDVGVMREVEDLQALVTATGASRAFGLSSGALVVLRTALVSPTLERVALYEPPLSVDGSAPTDWGPRFDREIAAGKPASALVTALKGTRTEPVLGRLPRLVLVPLLAISARLQGDVAEDDVPIAALIPTHASTSRSYGRWPKRQRTMRRLMRRCCSLAVPRARHICALRWMSFPPCSHTRAVSPSRAWDTQAQRTARAPSAWARPCATSSGRRTADR